jgi:DNA repair protein RadC
VLRLRFVREGACEAPRRINSPSEAADLFVERLQDEAQECLEVLTLKVKNEPLGVHQVYRGSTSASLVKVGEIVRVPLLAGAPAFIVVHDHPSGDPSPRAEDIAITKQITEAARLMDLEFLDHLIVGHGRWVSMREQGLMG